MTTVRQLNDTVNRVMARFEEDLNDTKRGIEDHKASRAQVSAELENIINVVFAVLTPQTIKALDALPSGQNISALMRALSEQNAERQNNYQSLMARFNSEAEINSSFKTLQTTQYTLENEAQATWQEINAYDKKLLSFDIFQRNTLTPITDDNVEQFKHFSLLKFIFSSAWRKARELLKENPNLLTDDKKRAALKDHMVKIQADISSTKNKIYNLEAVIRDVKTYHQTYQSPIKQAETVRQHILNSIIQSDHYLDKVKTLLPVHDAQAITVLTLKIRALDRIIEDTAQWKNQLDRNIDKLRTPQSKLQKAARRNPSKTIYSAPDLEALEKASMGSHVITTYKLQNGKKSRKAVEAYSANTYQSTSMADAFMIYMLLQSASDTAYLNATLAPSSSALEAANLNLDEMVARYDDLNLGQSFDNLSSAFNSDFDKMDLSNVDDMVRSFDQFDSGSLDGGSSSWDSGSSSWDSGSSSYDSGGSSFDSGGGGGW